jgi:UV DNA damage endonuclease
MKHIFGYACISDLNPTIKTGSSSTLTYINKLPLEQRGPYLLAKAKANILSLSQLLVKNRQNKIKAYRMPDSFMPMADLGYYSVADNFAEPLRALGTQANSYDMFLSFHPSQFFVLNSATPHVVDNAIHNFNIFAEILDLMQLKNKPVLLTHVGARSTYDTRELAVKAFCDNFQRLSPSAQKYFAVENDQSAHSIDSCMDIHRSIGIPVVIDNAHYNYKPVDGLSLADAAKLAMSTWHDQVPKVHLSSELEGSPRHAHADYVRKQDFLDFYRAVKASGIERVIFMVEAKKKDRAIDLLRS